MLYVLNKEQQSEVCFWKMYEYAVTIRYIEIMT